MNELFVRRFSRAFHAMTPVVRPCESVCVICFTAVVGDTDVQQHLVGYGYFSTCFGLLAQI